MANKIVDTTELVRDLVESIENAKQNPFIFLDLEGVYLSRHGSIAIMQVLVPPNPMIHLVDVHVLQKDAFNIPGAGGQTLKSILESKDYAKVFFDVRNDSDALFSHYQVGLRGVVDLQLLEFACRPGQKKYLKGLAKCISEVGGLGWAKAQEWQHTKDAGLRLFAPEKGGRYEVFLERPLAAALREYCAQDVLVMPKLLCVYGGRVTSQLTVKINAEALARVALSQTPDFNGKGQHMAIGPSFGRHGTTGAAPDFPMSIVCSDQLVGRCAIDASHATTTVAPVQDENAPPSTIEGTKTESQERIGVVTEALKSMELLGAGSEQKVSRKQGG